MSAAFPSPVVLRPFSLGLACRVSEWLAEADSEAAGHFAQQMHRRFPVAVAFGAASREEERAKDRDSAAAAANAQGGGGAEGGEATKADAAAQPPHAPVKAAETTVNGTSTH